MHQAWRVVPLSPPQMCIKARHICAGVLILNPLEIISRHGRCLLPRHSFAVSCCGAYFTTASVPTTPENEIIAY